MNRNRAARKCNKDASMSNIQRKQRRGYATHPAIQAAVTGAVEAGEFSAAKLHRELTAELENVPIPVVRTLHDMIKEAREEIGMSIFQPWSVGVFGDGHDDELMLMMMTEMIDDSAGRYPRISKGLAKWMIRLKRAAARDVSAGLISYLATLYLRRERVQEPTGDLDAFLAYAPWRSARATTVYLWACDRNEIQRLPGLMGLHPLPPATDTKNTKPRQSSRERRPR
jgi:hypothetical protein